MAGQVEFIAGGPYAWRAYRSKTTPISTTQGEYVAGSNAAVSTIAHRDIQTFLGMEPTGPTVLFCDNLSAVQLSDGNTSSKRMQHIATRIAFLREMVKEGHILLYHISTTGQVADIFTKPLSAATFHSLRELLLRTPEE